MRLARGCEPESHGANPRAERIAPTGASAPVQSSNDAAPWLSRGYVRFDLYSVPNGRRVVISSPTIKNVVHASDSVQYTSSLPKGSRERVETPVDGMDVWRTVSVYQDGRLLRRNIYYSHYARITGVLLIGTGG